MRQAKGFTLVEVTLVIIAIGILVTLAIPIYVRSIERTKCASAISTLQSMRNAAILFFRENQTFVGMTVVHLETTIGATFHSGDTHPDWTFGFAFIAADDFTLVADRKTGPHSGTSIEYTSDEHFDSSSYPWENPGIF